jgi:hypothetical protein
LSSLYSTEISESAVFRDENLGCQAKNVSNFMPLSLSQPARFIMSGSVLLQYLSKILQKNKTGQG